MAAIIIVSWRTKLLLCFVTLIIFFQIQISLSEIKINSIYCRKIIFPRWKLLLSYPLSKGKEDFKKKLKPFKISSFPTTKGNITWQVFLSCLEDGNMEYKCLNIVSKTRKESHPPKVQTACIALGHCDPWNVCHLSLGFSQ